MDSEAYPPLYLKGIAYFNEFEFFESHDIWEELWSDYQGPSRRFYQGLIQVAVCLHHFNNGNTRGARKLFHSSRDYLKDYAPEHMGLDVDRLLREMEVCCAEIIETDEEFPRGELNPELIPILQFDPSVELPPVEIEDDEDEDADDDE